MIAASAFWASVLLSSPQATWAADVRRIVAEAETRRERADYNTGSILETEAYALRALAEYLKAKTVVEVGTFIGTSTCALASAATVQAVYTCDASNDCLRATETIATFPKVSSATMLRRLAASKVKADLCFLDGTLRAADIAPLKAVMRKGAIFAVHDYNYGPKRRVRHGVESYETVPRKGIGNIRLLQPHWPDHMVIEPRPETTLALFVPSELVR